MLRIDDGRLLYSVCLSGTFVHCAQTAQDIDTIRFAYDSSMFLPDRVKTWLTSDITFLPKFYPKVTHSYWFEGQRHSMANCSRMVRYSCYCNGHNEKPIENHHPSFEWYYR